MRPRTVALASLAGMLLTSLSVYSLTPLPSGAGSGALEVTAELQQDPGSTSPGGGERSRFFAGKTVTLDGRLGHARLLRGGGGSTFLLLEARAQESEAARVRPPVHLGLVIDRSGSMAGARIENARRAALGAVDRLNDGDKVSVVAFDTGAVAVVPMTTVDAGSRPRIAAAIRSIAPVGDTCISCGIEEAMAHLGQTPERVRKVILLSDGDANRGVTGLAGLRDLGRRAMSRGVGLTTIGVDVEYNERILTALAEESNGRHYFVENDAALARVFEAEAEATTTTVASGAEASIELAPGVELVRVLDRTFRRSGDRIVVPLGEFARGDVKTVLVEVRVPDGALGEVPVARATLGYRDLVEGRDARCEGELAVEVTGDAARASETDGVVLGRVNRSETADTLSEANALFAKGEVAEARRRLSEQAARLRGSAPKAASAAPVERKADVDGDFKRQLDDLEVAGNAFAAPAASPEPGADPAPPQATRAGKAAVKLNAERSFESRR